jgi:hypothetical protein
LWDSQLIQTADATYVPTAGRALAQPIALDVAKSELLAGIKTFSHRDVQIAELAIEL